MRPQRSQGWERALEAYLRARRTTPFEWGGHDCCRFCCGALAAMGLPDPMAEVGGYRTPAGAAKAMKRHFGAGDLDACAEHVAAAWGAVEVKPEFAGRGDPVLAEIETPPDFAGGQAPGGRASALGVVGLDGMRAWFAAPRGLTWRPVAHCRRAWRVA